MSGARLLISAVMLAVFAIVAAVAVQGGLPARAGALNVDQADGACSDVSGAPYCTIGGALADASGGDTIKIFPGTYAESVDLSAMGTPGDISLFSVDTGGVPTASTVAIESPAGPAITNTVPQFPGVVTIDGFTVSSPDDAGIDLSAGGDAIIRNVTANENGGDGVTVNGNGHAITLSDSTLSENAGDGFNPFNTSAPLIVTNVIANFNGQDGMELNVSGPVSISGSTTNGNLGIGFGGNGVNTPTDGALTIADSRADDNVSDGFEAHGASSISVSGSVADSNGNDGMQLDADGDVTIVDSVAAENDDDGYQIASGGDVEMTDSHAATNGDDGFEIAANGDVTIGESGSYENEARGFNIDLDGSLTFERSASNDNGNDGLNFDLRTNDVNDAIVRDSIFFANATEGVDYPSAFAGVSQRTASGNIICGNGGGLDVDGPSTIDAEGNWWGAASGPTHPLNAGGSGDEIFDAANGSDGTADYTPWIDTISGTNGEATQGQPKTITFEFTGGAGAVALTDGPGDPSGILVFSATTDNGTVQTSSFIEDGVLEVVLTPDTPGTATVTVNGPCGLGDEVGGNSVEVTVVEGGTEVIWGDDDCNNAVNAVDGLKNLQEIAGIPYGQEAPCFTLGDPVSVTPSGAAQILWGDIDCDGDLDSVDALGILRSVAGLPVNQQPQCPEIGESVLVSE